MMRTAGGGPDGARLRALIARRRAVLVGHGKGDKRREVGMDRWAWEHLESWQQLRVGFPVGPLFCVIHGPTAGRHWEPASARRQLGRTAAAAGVRRRFAPHQLRHAHAVEMAHDGIALPIIQRQLGHAHLGVTSIYLQGIDNAEIIDAVHARRPPVIPGHRRSAHHPVVQRPEPLKNRDRNQQPRRCRDDGQPLTSPTAARGPFESRRPGPRVLPTDGCAAASRAGLLAARPGAASRPCSARWPSVAKSRAHDL